MEKKDLFKKIVFILFCLIFCTTCASNCSKQNTIRDNKVKLELRDSTITVLTDSVESLNDSINDLSKRNEYLENYIKLLGKNNSDLNKALNRKVIVNVTSNSNEQK